VKKRTKFQNNMPIETIPSHFFERGPYEVWAWRNEWAGGRFTGKHTLQMIAGGLCEETARVMQRGWPASEIQKDGKVIV
jgi:hypothetical protein